MKLLCIQGRFLKTNDSPLYCFFNTGNSEMNQTQKYSNFLHIYCDANHARYISDMWYVTSTSHLFNSTIKDLRHKKQYDT